MVTTHVPKSFSGDVLLTVAYLVNRMPSSVLQFQSPMELLSKSYSNASPLSPKIFGGLCFVHNPLSRKVVVSVLEILPKSFLMLLLSPKIVGGIFFVHTPHHSH